MHRAEQRAESIRANYTKYEHLVPMRDGARLLTSIYVPKDATTPAPFLLDIPKATADQFRKATQRGYRGGAAPFTITVHVESGRLPTAGK